MGHRGRIAGHGWRVLAAVRHQPGGDDRGGPRAGTPGGQASLPAFHTENDRARRHVSGEHGHG